MTDVRRLSAVADPAPPYPSEPWALRGQMHASVYVVPLADVPVDLPAGCRPIRVGRFGVVGTAWVSYEPGGVLDYHELLATVLVRCGWRVLPSVTHIWVDSAASRDGGRALWGIPKRLASFAFGAGHFGARDAEGPLAAGTVHPRAWLPGRWPVGFSLVQLLDGRAKISPVRAKGRLGLSRATFDADPTGPLAFLSGRTPVLSFTMGDFRMSFGSR